LKEVRVIRKTALLVVLVLTVGTVRVLTCELACTDQAARQDATCHDNETATSSISGASHHCDYGTMAPALSALQKPTVLQHPAAVCADLRAGTVLPSGRPDRFFTLPPGVSPVMPAPRTPVLRI
jgi:hypothetical protein